MIKKKPIIKKDDNSFQGSEFNIAKLFIDNRKYIILNEFVTYMRLNYNLNYTNSRAIDILNKFRLKRKRIAFDTVSGIKHSKNEFINDFGLDKIKPIVKSPVTHDQVIEKVAIDVLEYIRDNFSDLGFMRGIINFNMFDTEAGIILLFDNLNLKEILRRLTEVFPYDVDYIPYIASKIRSMSEPSYLRENEYNANSIRVSDKKFYTYTFKGEK